MYPRQLTEFLYRQSLIPVVMSGIIAVYGLVIAVLIAQAVGPTTNMSLYTYVEKVEGRKVGQADNAQRLHALGCRNVRWSYRCSCWVYDRSCGRCGTDMFATAEWTIDTNRNARVFGHTCNNPESMLE